VESGHAATTVIVALASIGRVVSSTMSASAPSAAIRSPHAAPSESLTTAEIDLGVGAVEAADRLWTQPSVRVSGGDRGPGPASTPARSAVVAYIATAEECAALRGESRRRGTLAERTGISPDLMNDGGMLSNGC